MPINTSGRKVFEYDAELHLPNGQTLSPVSASTVARMVDEDGSVTGSAIAFGLIGYMVAANAEETATRERAANYQSKAFTRAVLYQGQAQHGFLFFNPPSGTPMQIHGDLNVPFVDEDTSEAQAVSVPLLGGIPKSTVVASASPTGAVVAPNESPAESPTETKPIQSLDGLWRARGTTWVVEIEVSGDTANITAECGLGRSLGNRFSGHGTIDSHGKIGTVNLSPRNNLTPTLSGTIDNMTLYANGWTCLSDELQFHRV